MTPASDPLEGLKSRFRDRLAGERALLAESEAGGEFEALRSICHRIAGAGGMFGFDELGALASRLEEAIDEGAPPSSIRGQTTDLLAAIDRVVGQKVVHHEQASD